MSTTTSAAPAREARVSTHPGMRLASLDIFRGATIAAMILVNDPGDWNHVYRPLLHAEWNGWTPTDLIFPFFLFIAGVSMVFSFAARQERGASRGELIGHVLRRSAIIFGIGLVLNGAPFFHWSEWRIPGVLQRIGVAYLGAGAATLYAKKRTRYIIAVVLLLAYWAAMKLVPVPGFGAGVLTPDGNLAAFVDRALMYNHLWVAHSWDPEGLLSTVPAMVSALIGVFAGEWLRAGRAGLSERRGGTPISRLDLRLKAGTDAESFGGAPATGVNLRFPERNDAERHEGSLISKLDSRLQARNDADSYGDSPTTGVDHRLPARSDAKTIAGLVIAGVLGMVVGEVWGQWFPINKNIWTSSYVVFTGGFALLLLAACYWAVEVRGWRTWGKPFVWYGSNAIVVYALSSLAGKISISVHVGGVLLKTWLYTKLFAPLASPIHASLLWASAYVITFWILAWILHRKKIFIKV